ncbi:MAG: DUF3189 family protein [Peptococcaceae bacterium]|nr:DUF3189 family protein [Peptococcaceae bacterium]
MKIIYHCYGGTHSSVLAAAIHTGRLDTTKIPSTAEFFSLPFFDTRSSSDIGIIVQYGSLQNNIPVFILGRKGYCTAPSKIFNWLAEIFGVKEKYIIIDTTPTLNWQMKLGGYLSRRLGLIRLGRPFIIWGARRAFKDIVNLVLATQRRLLL